MEEKIFVSLKNTAIMREGEQQEPVVGEGSILVIGPKSPADRQGLGGRREGTDGQVEHAAAPPVPRSHW